MKIRLNCENVATYSLSFFFQKKILLQLFSCAFYVTICLLNIIGATNIEFDEEEDPIGEENALRMYLRY